MDEEEIYIEPEPTHEVVECTPDYDTRITTSVVSYIYQCPICLAQKRYAVPANGEAVFCTSLDFKTDTK